LLQNWASSHLQARHSNASSTTSSVRYKRKRSSCSSTFHPATPSSDSDNDFTEKEGESPPVIASTLRIHLNPMDFDYFTSVVRSDDEMERTKSRRKRVDPGAFYTEQTKAAADAELSVNQLCQLLIDLIRKLCISEPSDSSNQTSVQSVTFSLEQLCSLQFGALTLGAAELDLELKCCLSRQPRCNQYGDSQRDGPAACASARRCREENFSRGGNARWRCFGIYLWMHPRVALLLVLHNTPVRQVGPDYHE
jgi:hypothetical protein